MVLNDCVLSHKSINAGLRMTFRYKRWKLAFFERWMCSALVMGCGDQSITSSEYTAAPPHHKEMAKAVVSWTRCSDMSYRRRSQRPKTRWRDYIYWLTWERLDVSQISWRRWGEGSWSLFFVKFSLLFKWLLWILEQHASFIMHDTILIMHDARWSTDAQAVY